MSFINSNCKDFVDALASKASVPGGGGGSALVGALGIALGNMVGALTIGKEKYAKVEEDIIRLMAESDTLQNELLLLVDADAEAFEPLSKAYGIPKDDPARGRIMEDALRTASDPPMEIMRACARAIDVIGEFAEKGSVMAISDSGAGAAFARAALVGASFNVYINTKSMTDREYADKINAEADALLKEYIQKAENIVALVFERLR